MVEEETGLQTDENTEQKADSQADNGTPEKTEAEKIDWEKRYKDLQADHTRTSQRLADVEARLENTPSEEQPSDDYEEESFLDRKTAEKLIDKKVKEAVSADRQIRADAHFRRTYPEYVDDEAAISGILRSPNYRDELIRLNSPEDRVDFAVKKFKERLEKASADAAAKAETEAKEREEKNRKAAGLGGPSTAPAKSEEEGLSDKEELQQRKARLAKKRNMA